MFVSSRPAEPLAWLKVLSAQFVGSFMFIVLLLSVMNVDGWINGWMG